MNSLEVSEGLGRYILFLPYPEQSVLSVIESNSFFWMASIIYTLLTKISINPYNSHIRNNRTLRVCFVGLLKLMVLVTIAWKSS